MSPRVALTLNIFLLSGVGCMGAGAWVRFGAGVGLMLIGALVIALTLWSAARAAP
jgi:hypothetical protein